MNKIIKHNEVSDSYMKMTVITQLIRNERFGI